MKKFCILFILCLLTLPMTGCGQNNDTPDASQSDTSTSGAPSNEPQSTDNSSTSAPENRDTNVSGSSSEVIQDDVSGDESMSLEETKGEGMSLIYGDQEEYVMVNLSGYLGTEESDEIMGNQYFNIAAGSTCSIVPSESCVGIDVGLLVWKNENGETGTDADNYKLYADGQVETVEEFNKHKADGITSKILATSEHPAYFIAGKNSGESSAIAGNPYSFELKDNGSMYTLVIVPLSETGEQKQLFIVPFMVKE